eukprot:jgi/Psemu1/30410/gm1.30410_g
MINPQQEVEYLAKPKPYHYTTLGLMTTRLTMARLMTRRLMTKPTPMLLLYDVVTPCYSELDRDGGDSDEEGSLAAAFDVQIQGCNRGEDDNKNNNKNDKLHVGMQDGNNLPQAPTRLPPSDNNKSKLGEPSWHDVDNPVTWNRFCYRSKEYKRWEFHYQNWVPEEDTPTFFHRYTSSRDLFPQERKGKESLVWLSLGSMDFNLEECLTVILYSSTSSSSPSIQMKRTRNK